VRRARDAKETCCTPAVTHIRSSTRGVRGSNDVIPLYAPEKYFLAFAPQESTLLQIPLSLMRLGDPSRSGVAFDYISWQKETRLICFLNPK